MNKSDAEMWRINIENDADMVCSMYGSETAGGCVIFCGRLVQG
jgi:hypothetical protein